MVVFLMVITQASAENSDSGAQSTFSEFVSRSQSSGKLPLKKAICAHDLSKMFRYNSL